MGLAREPDVDMDKGRRNSRKGGVQRCRWAGSPRALGHSFSHCNLCVITWGNCWSAGSASLSLRQGPRFCISNKILVIWYYWSPEYILISKSLRRVVAFGLCSKCSVQKREQQDLSSEAITLAPKWKMDSMWALGRNSDISLSRKLVVWTQKMVVVWWGAWMRACFWRHCW